MSWMPAGAGYGSCCFGIERVQYKSTDITALPPVCLVTEHGAVNKTRFYGVNNLCWYRSFVNGKIDVTK